MMRILFFSLLVILGNNAFGQQLKIGIVADCQYCDCDYNVDWNNAYREAPERLQQAVDTFNANHVDLVFHLGDFIDRDYSSFNKVMPIMKKLSMPYYFVLGNHDFSVADNLKSKVYDMLELQKPYYTIQKAGWLFIVLDGTEVSTYHSKDSVEINTATQEMKRYNDMKRAQSKPWNGAISKAQLEWLDKQLTKSDNSELNAIVFCHFPVLPKGEVNLWNDEEVVEILKHHKSAKAFFNGHHHPGNYEKSRKIHYVTFQGMVLTQDKNAFSIVELSSTHINIVGFGREPSQDLRIKQ